MVNSPTFSRGWLCTEEPAGCSGLRGRLTGRRDSSLHLYPRSSGGLREAESQIYHTQVQLYLHTGYLTCVDVTVKISRLIGELTF